MKGWKQAYTTGFENVVIVELDIPECAKVRHIPKYGLTRDIYVCDKAIVVSISSFDNDHHVDKAVSLRDSHFKYIVGQEVCAKLNEELGDRPGIYFFKTREQAENYEY